MITTIKDQSSLMGLPTCKSVTMVTDKGFFPCHDVVKNKTGVTLHLAIGQPIEIKFDHVVRTIGSTILIKKNDIPIQIVFRK